MQDLKISTNPTLKLKVLSLGGGSLFRKSVFHSLKENRTKYSNKRDKAQRSQSKRRCGLSEQTQKINSNRFVRKQKALSKVKKDVQWDR